MESLTRTPEGKTSSGRERNGWGACLIVGTSVVNDSPNGASSPSCASEITGWLIGLDA